MPIEQTTMPMEQQLIIYAETERAFLLSLEVYSYEPKGKSWARYQFRRGTI